MKWKSPFKDDPMCLRIIWGIIRWAQSLVVFAIVGTYLVLLIFKVLPPILRAASVASW